MPLTRVGSTRLSSPSIDVPTQYQVDLVAQPLTRSPTSRSLLQPRLTWMATSSELMGNAVLSPNFPVNLLQHPLLLTIFLGGPSAQERPFLFEQPRSATIRELTEDEEGDQGEDEEGVQGEDEAREQGSNGLEETERTFPPALLQNQDLDKEQSRFPFRESSPPTSDWDLKQLLHGMPFTHTPTMPEVDLGHVAQLEDEPPRWEVAFPPCPLDELLRHPDMTRSDPDERSMHDLAPEATEHSGPGTTPMELQNRKPACDHQAPQQATGDLDGGEEYLRYQGVPVPGASCGGPPMSLLARLEDPEELVKASQYTPHRPTEPCMPTPPSILTSVSRQTLGSRHYTELEDVFNSTPAPTKRKKARFEHGEEIEAEADPGREQWRVGKTPGHQGSHLKSPRKRAVDGDEDSRGSSLNQSIHHNAERVLKRPFRPPKVVLAKANPKSAPSVGAGDPKDPVNPGSPGTSGQPGDQSNKQLPVFRSRPLSHTPRLGKPFRTPAKNLGALTKPGDAPSSSPHAGQDSSLQTALQGPTDPSPTLTLLNRVENSPHGSTVTLSSPRAPRRSIPNSCAQGRGGVVSERVLNPRRHLAALEARARKLRDALRLISDPEEDERLVSLTLQWRAAGRAVIERLYTLVPKPEDSNESAASSFPHTQSFGGGSGYAHSQGMPTMFASAYTSSSPWRDEELTPEQTESLRKARRNADGDPVDADGELLLGPCNSNRGCAGDDEDEDKNEDELSAALRKVVERGQKQATGEYRPVSAYESGHDSWMETSYSSRGKAVNKDEYTELHSTSWNYGALMWRFGVDPALLGWSADDKDWQEVGDT